MKIPTIFYMNNCKIIQELYKKDIPAMERYAISVGNGKIIYIALKNPFSFSYYEKIVCDALYSIWQYQRYEMLTKERKQESVIITPTQVLACMSGKKNIRMRQGNSEKEEKLIEIMENLSHADLAIMWEEEMKDRHIEGVSPVIAGKMLPIQRIDGTKKFKLDLKRTLPLYEYASTIHQMIRIPERMLYCGPKILEDGMRISPLRLSNTDEVIQLKHILLQRIEMLRNEKNGFYNRSIRYYYPSHKTSGKMDGIFSLMNIKEENYNSASAWSNKKQALHKQIRKILDYYCAIGYLESYKDVGEIEGHIRRKGIIGIDIVGEIKNPDEI